MKTWILVLLFLCSACVQRAEETPEMAPEAKSAELRCAKLKNTMKASTGVSRAEFFVSVLKALEQQGRECSPKEAAAFLDSIFEIHCNELCQIREK